MNIDLHLNMDLVYKDLQNIGFTSRTVPIAISLVNDYLPVIIASVQKVPVKPVPVQSH